MNSISHINQAEADKHVREMRYNAKLDPRQMAKELRKIIDERRESSFDHVDGILTLVDLRLVLANGEHIVLDHGGLYSQKAQSGEQVVDASFEVKKL